MCIGAVAPVLGFILFGWGWAIYYHRTLNYFYHEIFLGLARMQAPILSLSLIINLLPFFLFLRFKRYRSARGVLAALFLYVPVVLYLKFG